MKRLSKRVLLGAVLSIAASGVIAAQAWAGTVDHSADDGLNGSLRFEVNNAASGELITINPGINPVLVDDVVFPTNVDLRGTGINTTTINGPANDRVFTIAVAGNSSIEDLTITGGNAPDGGAAMNPGDPGGAGQNGGAIRFNPANTGLLSLDSVRFNANHAGTGANGADGVDSGGSDGGDGGGGGSGGEGGAIYLQDGGMGTASLTVTNSIFEANTGGIGGNGGIGGDGGGGIGDNGGNGGSGGSGGFGGAINDLSGGTVTVTDTTFTNNLAGTGGNGGAGGNAFIDGSSGNGGSGGRGGGMVGSVNSVVNSTLNGNHAGNGGNAGVGGLFGGSGGLGGFGGGISSPQALTATNSTFTANVSGTGGNGSGIGGSGGAGGIGGAIQVVGPGSVLTNLTIASNTAGGGGTGAGGGSPGTGGGIYSGGGGVALTNWLISNNVNAQDPQTTANCDGIITYSTFGISFPANTGCAGSNGNPLLGPLQDNGGPTQTMALLPGSAAIDRVPVGADCPGAATTDQRGVTRPQGPACDVGAFEALFVPPVTPNTTTTTTQAKKKKCKKKKGKGGKKKRCKKKKKKK